MCFAQQFGRGLFFDHSPHLPDNCFRDAIIAARAAGARICHSAETAGTPLSTIRERQRLTGDAIPGVAIGNDQARLGEEGAALGWRPPQQLANLGRP